MPPRLFVRHAHAICRCDAPCARCFTRAAADIDCRRCLLILFFTTLFAATSRHDVAAMLTSARRLMMRVLSAFDYLLPLFYARAALRSGARGAMLMRALLRYVRVISAARSGARCR